MIPLLTGIGIVTGIKHLENFWKRKRNLNHAEILDRNQNRSGIGNFALESESESRLFIYPGIRIGIKDCHRIVHHSYRVLS